MHEDEIDANEMEMRSPQEFQREKPRLKDIRLCDSKRNVNLK